MPRKSKDYDEGYNFGYDEGFEEGRAAALEEREKRHPEEDVQRVFDVRIQRSTGEKLLIGLANFFLIMGLLGWVVALANFGAIVAGLAAAGR